VRFAAYSAAFVGDYANDHILLQAFPPGADRAVVAGVDRGDVAAGWLIGRAPGVGDPLVAGAGEGELPAVDRRAPVPARVTFGSIEIPGQPVA
jgi:hypothetical protein